MIVLVLACSLLTLAYAALMMAYSAGWKHQQEFIEPKGFVPSTTISVIIAARNEESNIEACIRSILANDYPDSLFEIIVVDDHSEDGTAEVVNRFSNNNVRSIRLADHINVETKSYKKAAIDAGVRNSRGALIITTDADCLVQTNWLKKIAAIYEAERPAMIVAPVIYDTDKSIVQVFQLIDFMSMQGITAAAHRLRLGNMSNGANLAFSREAYMQVEGYKGVDHLASGDDYLLMMKISKKFPGGISYLKDQGAIVSTAPQPDWKSFLQQRIRWASKSGKYDDKRLTAILMLVYLFNFAIFALVVCGFFWHVLFALVGGMLLVKIIFEYAFLRPVARFFNKESVLLYFFWLQPLHILYIVIAGFLGSMGVYKWKGRVVR